MGIDFSKYINNLNKHNSSEFGIKDQDNKNFSNSSLESKQIEILKEISRKLDKLNIEIPPKTFSRNLNLAEDILVDIAIVNGLLVFPDNGVFPMNLYIKDGKIHSIGNNEEIVAKKVIDAKGKHVMPGIIDPHVHLGLFAPLSEELKTETKSALVGGITTLGWYIGGEESHLSTFPKIIEDIGKYSYTDIIPHLVISSEQQRTEIVSYIDNLGVTSFKIYMNGIPGLIPDVDDGFILDVFEEIKKSNKKCIVCAHAENKYIVQRANKIVRDKKGDKASIQDWTDTHSDFAEEEAVMRLSFLAEKSEVPIYFVHISTKNAIMRLRTIKPYNRYVNVETTSPYLSLTKDSSNNNSIKMEPPFRDTDDVDALWEATQDDIIDTIGTDNVTMNTTEKNITGTVWEAIPGYPALETHLPVLLSNGFVKRRLPIEQIIAKITKKPAEIFGVYPQKGSLLPGSDADVIIVDMNLSKKVSASELNSRSDFSLYEGEILQGWPTMTIKGGKIVVNNGKFVEDVLGRCLYRD